MSSVKPVKVYQGSKLRHVSETCDVYKLPTGEICLKFCAANMTVTLPSDVVSKIIYAARNS